ncbi:MAG TPA: DUF2157 domain-containing protein [Terriglobia bacterium]|nr:DUF2157 domain-containing protein [Terriglobia bacterium]
MTVIERLQDWNRAGIVTDAQYHALSALVRNERFSVFLELNALLYLGVIAVVGGLAWTVQTHFTSLGDFFILTVLSLFLAGSLFYCFSRATAFSVEQTASPNFVFDYVLYFACLVLSVELGYLEFNFQWLQEAWPNYLLFSSIIFFILAHRFDNRLVLSLALSTLAGWCGLSVSRFGFISSEPVRLTAIVYGVFIAIMGTALHRQGLKRHFLETYLHIAANVVFLALVSGMWDGRKVFYLAALILLASVAIVLGVRFRRFAFVVYGTVFGYIGVSIQIVSGIHEFTAALAYIVTSGLCVIIAIAVLARQFGRDE